MTDSLLAPGREVLYKRYHTVELSVPKAPELDQAATSARARNKTGPKPGLHGQLFCMKGFYSQKCQLQASVALCVEWAGYLVH